MTILIAPTGFILTLQQLISTLSVFLVDLIMKITYLMKSTGMTTSMMKNETTMSDPCLPIYRKRFCTITIRC